MSEQQKGEEIDLTPEQEDALDRAQAKRYARIIAEQKEAAAQSGRLPSPDDLARSLKQ